MVNSKIQAQNQFVSVLIVDDDPLTIQALKDAFANSSRFNQKFKVINTAHHGKTAIDLLKSQSPDLVLLDLHLPDIWGGDIAKFTLCLKKPPRIVVMSGFPAQMSLEESVRLNIYGYLTKPFHLLNLKEALDKALNSEVHFTPEVYTQMHQNLLKQKQGIEWQQPLSQREAAIFSLLCQAYTPSEIAEELKISLNSVKTYLKRIWQKSNSPDFKTFKEKAMTAAKLKAEE